MKQLLMDIQTRLKTEIPALFVDEDWGQLDYFMPAAPVKYPCALINVGDIQYTNQGKLVQTGIGAVIITVADVKFTNTSSNAPVLQKQQAWKVYDTIMAVHQALHGWTGGPFYGPLTRTRMVRRKNDDGINLFDIYYSAAIKDDSATKQRARHSPVSIEIQGPEIDLNL